MTPDPSPPSTDPAESAPSTQTFQVTDIQAALGQPGPGSYPTIGPDPLEGDPATGPERPKIREREGSFAARPPTHPYPARPVEPRGPLLRGAGWQGGGVPGGLPRVHPWVCPGGIPRGVPGAYHTVPHHPATPRRARMGLWAQRPRGARCGEYTGNTREYTGIPGNTREYRVIPGNTR